jgi:ribosomal protein S18 acetylase RimI-like enzyme
MLFIAEDEQQRLGFANVAHAQHFTGEGQAYVGELAVIEGGVEGRGVGQALVQACEDRAPKHGSRVLVLDTGAMNNERARRVYQRLGFREESVKLAKLL